MKVEIRASVNSQARARASTKRGRYLRLRITSYRLLTRSSGLRRNVSDFTRFCKLLVLPVATFSQCLTFLHQPLSGFAPTKKRLGLFPLPAQRHMKQAQPPKIAPGNYAALRMTFSPSADNRLSAPSRPNSGNSLPVFGKAAGAASATTGAA